MSFFEKLSPRTRGYFFTIIAIVALSSTPSIVKIGLQQDIEPVPLLTYRLWLASILLWLYMLIWKRDKIAIDRRGLIGCLWAGLANGTALILIYFTLNRIDASLNAIIFALFPAVALLILTRFGQRFGRMELLRLALAIAGVAIVIGPGASPQGIGVMLAFGAMLIYNVYFVLIELRLGEYNSVTIAPYIITTMALLSTVVYAVTRESLPTFELSTTTWWVILYTAAISTALARVMLFLGIHRLGSGEASLLKPVQTLLSVLWAIALLGEQLGGWQWVGAALIVASAALAARQESQPTTERPAKHAVQQVVAPFLPGPPRK